MRRHRPLARASVQTVATEAALTVVHAALASLWEDAEAAGLALPPRWRDEFTTAVAEIAANSVRHAYPAGAPGPLWLRLSLSPTMGLARLYDRGRPAELPAEPAADLSGMPESGMGLLLARACLDRLTYRRLHGAVNRWALVKCVTVAPETR